MTLTSIEKETVLKYLKNGKEVASAASCVIDHNNSHITKIPLVAFSDGFFQWTTEDIYNLEKNNELFDDKIIKYILNN